MSSERRLPSHLSAAERMVLERFLAGVRAMTGADLLEARLFGSRARGEGNEESDLDVALIVTAAGRARRNEILDLAYDLMLEHEIEIAPLVIERERLEELRRRERLFARELDRHGIPL